MSLYNLRSTPTGFTMTKFDSDFNVEACYSLEPKGFSYTCDCPANLRSVVTKPCKHKRMMTAMLPEVNTVNFYDPETHTWTQPLGDLDRPEAGRYANEASGDEGPEPYSQMDPTLLEAGVDMHNRQMAKAVANECRDEPTSSHELSITDQLHEINSAVNNILGGQADSLPEKYFLPAKPIAELNAKLAPAPASPSTLRRR